MNPLTRRLGLLLSVFAAVAPASSLIGTEASTYTVLYENGGSNSLQITNVTVNGNIGVGNPVGSSGSVHDSGPSTINGHIDFAAANTGQFNTCGASCVVTGGEQYNVSAVTTALNMLNTLNSTLGAESGTSVGIGTGAGNTLTIFAGAGLLDASGNEVFDVSYFNTTNADVLTINGNGHNVVLNFTGSINFNNQVALNGLTSDQLLFNFVGGSNLTGGPTLQINDNASSYPLSDVQGIFLNPNGAISVTNTNLSGRVFGGDSHDMQIVSGDTLTPPNSVMGNSVPEPASLVLMGLGLLGIGIRLKKALAPVATF